MLGIADADTDDGVGVISPAAADHSPVLFVSHGGDGAGIDHIAVALVIEGYNLMTLTDQQLLHRLGLILICLAPEGIKTKNHC